MHLNIHLPRPDVSAALFAQPSGVLYAVGICGLTGTAGGSSEHLLWGRLSPAGACEMMPRGLRRETLSQLRSTLIEINTNN